MKWTYHQCFPLPNRERLRCPWIEQGIPLARTHTMCLPRGGTRLNLVHFNNLTALDRVILVRLKCDIYDI
jgi:hypothetical protein